MANSYVALTMCQVSWSAKENLPKSKGINHTPSCHLWGPRYTHWTMIAIG